jgi:hypothetical protein
LISQAGGHPLYIAKMGRFVWNVQRCDLAPPATEVIKLDNVSLWRF